MARDAGADQKDQRTDRSRAACDWTAQTRRDKIRKKDSPASRADRPSSPESPCRHSSRESRGRTGREHFFNKIPGRADMLRPLRLHRTAPQAAIQVADHLAK